jgi:predicted dehydrogenase
MSRSKIRLGIAGMGYVGRVHYEAAKKLAGVEVAAVTSRAVERTRAQFPELNVSPSLDDMFQRHALDAVVVCVPTFLHESVVVQAVGYGLHVMCEKPMALNAASAARMLEAAQKANVVFMVAQLLRFWPQYQKAKQMTGEGALGRLLSAAAYRLAKPPEWSDWFRDPAKSGGCLLDLQIHDMDFLFWLLGRPKVLQTFALKSHGAREHINTILTFADDQIATIEASYLMPSSWPFSCGLRLVGADSAFEYRFVSQDDIAGRAQSTESAFVFPNHGPQTALAVPHEDMFVAQLQHFIDCIHDPAEKMVSPPEQSYEVMKLMDASYSSAVCGQPVSL